MPDWMRSSVTELQPWYTFIKAVPRGQQESGKMVTMVLPTVQFDFLCEGCQPAILMDKLFLLLVQQDINLVRWVSNRHGNKTFQGRASDCQASHSAPMLAIWALHIPAAERVLLQSFQHIYLSFGFRGTMWGEQVVTSDVQSWAVWRLLCDPVEKVCPK